MPERSAPASPASAPLDTGLPAGVTVRLADPTEIDVLVAIDDDACRLDAIHGVDVSLPSSDPFAMAERSRWRESARKARVFVAVDAVRECVGFAALDQVDGQPYLDQLSVRLGSMRPPDRRAFPILPSVKWPASGNSGTLATLGGA
jgi:hypothetical protein